MKKSIYILAIFLITNSTLLIDRCIGQINAPIISNLTYDSITQTGVSLFWSTDIPADSKVKWMAPDSNYQAIIYTDSSYNAAQLTNHIVHIRNLRPATIYKYNVISQNQVGSSLDSG
ncbi:MAG: fibronectin type III domain-containing protein, partial [Bacteroidales bacterium]